MIRIYVAADLPDAHIVLNLLEQGGISVRVFNANAQSGVGEIPFTQAYPEVWVMRDEDYARAKQIIIAHERAPEVNETILCRACAEENPRNFEICWHCGKRLGTSD